MPDDQQCKLPPPAIVYELRRHGSATVFEAAGRKGAVVAPLMPIDPTVTMAGPARLVECPPGDNLPLHRAVAAATAGEILVTDAMGYDRAGHWGEILTVAAMARGIAGLVIDGSVRDAGPIAERGFPVFHRNLCVITASKEAPENAPPQEIELGGVVIRNGDWIVGDRDGVVAVPADRIQEVLAAARKRTDEESQTMIDLASGATTLELFGIR